jgi:hypothetical protein
VLLSRAGLCIIKGEVHFRKAAEYIAQAAEQGATQRKIAARVGKSVAWVNALLAWHRGGCQDTPFGSSAVQASHDRAVVQDLNKTTPHQDSPFDPTKTRTVPFEITHETVRFVNGAVVASEQATPETFEKVDVLGIEAPPEITRKVTIRGYQKNEIHQKLAELSGPEMVREYTKLIKEHKLYHGACELPWSRYFEYRDTHPECTPLTSADIAYVQQWTSAAHASPSDVSLVSGDSPHPSYSAIWLAAAFRHVVQSADTNPEMLSEIIDLVGSENFRQTITMMQAAYDAKVGDDLDDEDAAAIAAEAGA